MIHRYLDGSTSEEYIKERILHCDDKPAIEKDNGVKVWYRYGVEHRDNGPAVEYPDGSRIFKVNGLTHRLNGPAIEKNDKQLYFIDGHNLSYEKWCTLKNSYKTKSGHNYFIDGKICTKEYFYLNADCIITYFCGSVSNTDLPDRIKHSINGEPSFISKNGTKIWHFRNRIHREGDLPAVVSKTEIKYFHKDKLHREDGPAVINEVGEFWYHGGKQHRISSEPTSIFKNGKIEYHRSGVLHRKNGPAVIYPDGKVEYYNHGVLHRVNEPAVFFSNGDKFWYVNGKFHREDGPALEYSNGDKHWYINGKRHREDGPAVIHSTGKEEYWVNNNYYSKKSFERLFDKYHYSDGTVESKLNPYKNLHNPNGPAITFSSNKKEKPEYWLHGFLHNENGPARIKLYSSYDDYDDSYDNYEIYEYYLNGRLHRIAGPAIECHCEDCEKSDSMKQFHNEYWIDGRQYTKEKFEIFVKSHLTNSDS